MKYLPALTLGLAFILCGCTSVEVRPIPTSNRITSVVIVKNEKVAIDDFLDVLVDGFQRHGIAVKTAAAAPDSKDAYVVTYVAYRKWDLAPYMVDATINIEKDGLRVGHAQYHLNGGGGFSMLKWEGTKTKLDPVIDELLKDYAIR